MPEVSIVFTSYNHKKYLNKALDSILSQTFSDFELIIIDDCSTDGSQLILKEYEKKDRRIKLVLNEINSGSYVHSSNQGASLATTSYLIFAQCDDWAEPNQLKILFDAMKNNDVGVVFSSSNMVDSQGLLLDCDFNVRSAAFRTKHNVDSIIPGNEAFLYLLESCIIPNLSAALIKKDLFDKLKGLSDSFLVLADWDLWIRASSECDFYYIRKPLNNFRQHGGTIRSTIKMKKQINEVFEMIFSLEQRRNIPQITCSRVACKIWIHWAGNDKMNWIRSFPSLFYSGIKKSIFVAYAFPEQLTKLVFKKIYNSFWTKYIQ